MGKVTPTTTAAVSVKKLGWIHKFPRDEGLDTLQDKKKLVVVEVTTSLDKRSAMVHSNIPKDHNRCKFLGMGSPSKTTQ